MNNINKLNEEINKIIKDGEIKSENLKNIDLSNLGIYKEISYKIGLIIKSQDKVEVIKLKNLLNAISIVGTNIREDEIKSPIQDVDGKQTQELKIKKKPNILLKKLKNEQELDPQKFTTLFTSGDSSGYIGEDQFFNNEEAYEYLVEAFLKYGKKELFYYEKSMAEYILKTVDFKGGKIRHGELLEFCAKYYPLETAKLAKELIEEKHAVLRNCVLTTLGYDPQNEEYLYQRIQEFLPEKKGGKIKDNGEFRGILRGLLRANSEYYKEIYTILYPNREYLTIEEIEKLYVENIMNTAYELNKEVADRFLETFEETWKRETSEEKYDYIDKLQTYTKSEKISLYLKLFRQRIYTKINGKSYLGLSDSILKIFKSATADDFLIIKEFIEEIVNLKMENLKNNYIRIDEYYKRYNISFNPAYCFEYYNNELFDDNSIQIKILDLLLQIDFGEAQYKKNINTYTNFSILLQNIAKTNFYQKEEQKEKVLEAQDEIIEFKNKNMQYEWNHKLNKVNVLRPIFKSELMDIKNFSIRYDFKESNIEDLQNFPNVETLRISTRIDASKISSKFSNLKNIELYADKPNLDMNSIKNHSKIESLKGFTIDTLNIDQLKTVKFKNTLKKIRIHYYKKLEYDLSLLEDFPNLEEIYIEVSVWDTQKDIDLNGLSKFSSKNKIKKLTIDSNRIITFDSKIIAEFKNLEYLYFSEVNIENIDSLKNLNKIKDLTLKNLDLDNIKIIENFKSLETLTLYECNIKNLEGINVLSNTLKEFDIRESYNSSNEMIDLKKIEHLENLEILKIYSYYKEVKNLHLVEKFKKLKIIFLGIEDKRIDINNIKNLENLEVVELCSKILNEFEISNLNCSEKIRRLEIVVGDEEFDCSYLMPLKNLESLEIRGPLKEKNKLNELPFLREIKIRY